jgi:phosphopantothenoylcysteine decarboxylase/phosphopantothenate--cysteine ligase
VRCVVTAGPTYEALDGVRRLTNFSTGRLGTDLTSFLTGRGHEVTLLLGQQSTYREARKPEFFTTTSDLREKLRALATQPVNAVFHAAAVSDFSFGKIWARSAQGELKELKESKISSREGTLLAELLPTPKIIAELRQWFPKARLVGWKYEANGIREDAIRQAEKQLGICLTDACVVNGPAYGEGFGLVQGGGEYTHLEDNKELFEILEKFIRQEPGGF